LGSVDRDEAARPGIADHRFVKVLGMQNNRPRPVAFDGTVTIAEGFKQTGGRC
jgi:hypothetical protein